jgi:hypothetical protein
MGLSHPIRSPVVDDINKSTKNNVSILNSDCLPKPLLFHLEPEYSCQPQHTSIACNGNWSWSNRWILQYFQYYT